MKSKKIGKTLVYFVSIAAALAAGGISSVFAMSAMKEYGALRQPAACAAAVAFPGCVDNFVRCDGDIGGKNIYCRQAGPQRKNSSVRRQFGYRRAGGVCAPRLPRSAHFEYALDAAVFHA